MSFGKFIFVLGLTLSISLAGVSQSAEFQLKVDESLKPNNKVNLYPQPATEFIIVRIENSTLAEASFELFNIIGTPVKVDVEEINNGEYKIWLKDLNTGYYMVVIKDTATRYQKAFKFLKK